MSLSSLLIIFSSSFMALFPVINPLGNGFVVNGFFANLDPSQRKTAILLQLLRSPKKITKGTCLHCSRWRNAPH